MGADLYINKLFKANSEVHRPAFEAAVAERDACKQQVDACGQKYVCARKPHTRKKWLAKQDEWRVKQAAAQEIVSQEYDAMHDVGYFRDSYNATDLLWVLGLSWWGNVTPMLNKAGNLRGDKLLEFREMVAKRRVPTTARLAAYLEKQHACVDDGENSVAEWRKFFTEKRKRLLAFLDEAIRLKAPVVCSL